MRRTLGQRVEQPLKPCAGQRALGQQVAKLGHPPVDLYDLMNWSMAINGVMLSASSSTPWRSTAAPYSRAADSAPSAAQGSSLSATVRTASAATRPIPRGVTASYLRRRQIKHTTPEPKNRRANRQRRGSRGGRPTCFDKTIYKRMNEVERTINTLKNFRAVATRCDKRVYVFQGTVTVSAIRLWLRE